MEQQDGFITVCKKQLKKKTEPEKQKFVPKLETIELEKPKKYDPKLLENNKKRILCHNMYTSGKCPYNHNCVFAHNLEDQKVDPIRRKIYNILLTKKQIQELDLINDIEMYNELKRLTRICYGCEKKTCTGGYNCKNGAINAECVICYSDLYTGKCTYKDCNKVHLTIQGLVPYKIQYMIFHGYSEMEKKEYVEMITNIIPKPIEVKNTEIEKTINIKILEKLDFEKDKKIIDDLSSCSFSECSDEETSDTEYLLSLIP
jgi:hypothetical protein